MKRMKFLNSVQAEAKKAAELAAAREADKAYKAAHKKFAENKISNVDYDFAKLNKEAMREATAKKNYYNAWGKF